MTPRHEVFRAVYGVCAKVGDTYDYLPDAGTKYPFIYIAGSEDDPQRSTDALDRVSQTLHIYAERTQRTRLEQMIAEIRYGCKIAKGLHDYHLQNTGYTERIIPDNTDVKPLLHAVIEVNFLTTRKEE